MKSFLLFALLLGSALLCAGCAEEPPGKGATAEKGYALTNPLIEKLETFHQQQGKYPAGLDEIAPDFETQKPKELDFGYTPLDSGKGYDLYFAYYGPGMNVCHYTSAEKTWRCSGAY